MTNEQKEMMECLADRKEMDLIEVIRIFKREGIKNFAIVRKEYLDRVLSLIKEQQVEIDGLKNKEVLIKRYFKKCDLIKQLKKQIDLMAEYISKQDVEADICMKNKTNPDWCNEDYTNCKDCIKQYFERKVEDETK